jgi:hypothetical protein
LGNGGEGRSRTGVLPLGSRVFSSPCFFFPKFFLG